MHKTITKSDFLKYLQCPAYFWFWKKKPEVLTGMELSDFEKELVKNGVEVENWARKLFPRGILVESRQMQAVTDTKKLLDTGEKFIFQATFEAEGLYVMVDILEWSEENQNWIINEVKGSTMKEKKKNEHLYDAAFQHIVLEKAGFSVGRVNLIELNKEFVKHGEISPVELLQVADITEEVKELESEIMLMIDDMKRLLDQEREPMPCDCIYESRANQCPAFNYLYPDVPDYTVHDIVRIGSSKKKLEALIEGDYILIEDVPEDFKLSKYQRNHVDVTQTKIPIIKTSEIKKELEGVEYPLYFLDYETFPTAIPVYDGCKPYQQIPFQYSLHIQHEPYGELEHCEFLQTDNGTHPMKCLAYSLMEKMKEDGTIVVWNKKFEGKCHEDIAELMPEYAEVFHGYNQKMFDLMDIFSKNLYAHHDFRGSYSIKKVLPVLVPELSYKGLNVSDGSMAMNAWKKMMFETEDQEEKEQIIEDLLKYCELDTLAMVKIFEALEKL